MTLEEVMSKLESFSDESIKNIYLKQGAEEPLFGVKIGNLKKIVKEISKDYELSLALYDTDNVDAMYLAGLIADEGKMTRSDLKSWAENARWYMISEYTVAWIAAESDYGWELGLKWIKSGKEHIAAAGWATLASLISIRKDDDIDLSKIQALLHYVGQNIDKAPNRVKYTMNGFVIAVGSFMVGLSDEALQIAEHIGKVDVKMGESKCKVPIASEYINKVRLAGRLGKKRKMARC